MPIPESHAPNSVLERLLAQIARHRMLTLGAAFALFAAAALSLPWWPGGRSPASWLFAGMPQLRFDDSPERWMPRSSVEAWQKFERHFERGDSIGIAIHFKRPVRDDDVVYLADLRRQLLGVPGIVRVIDMSVVAQQVEDVPLTVILKDPADRKRDPYAMYRGTLFDDPRMWSNEDSGNPQQRTLIAYVELDTGINGPQWDREEVQQRRRSAVTRLFEILEAAEREDVAFHVIGAVVIQHELERMAQRILAIFVPISLLLTFLALGVGFRSFPPVLLAVLAAVWSVTVLMGGIVWAGWTLNVVTVGGPTLMFVIVVATTVHFAHYEADRPAGHHNLNELPLVSDRDARNRHFVRWVGVPCLGAAVTTGFGFLMLAFNDLAPTRELGIELCIGAILAFVGAFVVRLFVPAGKPQQGRWLNPSRLRSWYQLVAFRPGAVAIAMLAVTVALGAAASRIKTDPDPFSFFHKESKLARAFDHLEQRHFGMYLVDVVLVPKHRPQDPAQREIETEKDRRAAKQFRDAIQQRPEVRSVVSTSQMRAQRDRIDIGNLRRLRAFRDVFRSWVEDRAGEDAERITFKVDDLGDGFSDLMAVVRAELPEDRFECIYSGTAADIGVLADGLIGGMTRGLATAFAVMTLVCAFWFRSWRLTLIAVLPNVFPVLFVLGVMGAFHVPLNSGTVMVTTIALGVALNDTVHFIMHYRERRLEGEAADTALGDTFAEIGRPIVLTSVVNCLGFSIFLLSEFRPMWEFGLMTGIAMLAALFGDLVLLPSLLSIFDRDPPGREVSPANVSEGAIGNVCL